MSVLPHPRDQYKKKLSKLPPSGGGGCHPALLGVASLGMMAGYTEERIFMDLRRQVHGTREVPDNEIRAAIDRAVRDRNANRSDRQMPMRRPRRKHGDTRARRGHAHNDPTIHGGHPMGTRAFMADRLNEAEGITEVDIWESSPVRIDSPPELDAALLLEALYRPEDVLFLGGIHDRAVNTVAGWLGAFAAGRAIPPHIIPNPLTGKMGRTKNGRGSLRADDCVKSFRFAVAEFDEMSREDQVRFWWAVDLPVCALIDSGGKSLHAWIRIDEIETADEWTDLVEERLFRHYLTPLGCDAACRNEARLSRLPGHFREEKGRWQRLLYLAPEGRAIHASS